MTDLTGPLVLPASLRLTPVAELEAETRERLEGEPGDVALTDPGSRTPSRLVSADTAALLERFRTPTAIAQAILAFSLERGLDPGPVLEEAYPRLRRLADDGFLVPAGGPEARGTSGSLRRGDRFAGFEILQLCQATEDSEVLQARGPEGVVALKVERHRAASVPTQSLDLEALVLERLAGEIAPRLLARGVEEGSGGASRRWLALEWLPGSDAGSAAGEFRSRPELEARRSALHALGTSLLASYAGLHERGVVHGDVHPRNVIVAADGSVRLLDFGIAALSQALEEGPRASRGGVAFYYEPENAASMLETGVPLAPTFAGEQYSLAALLYHLLTGVLYREFPLTRQAMLREIVEGAPRRFAELGLDPWPAAEEILARALAKIPAERFPSVATFAVAWNGIASVEAAEKAESRPAPRRGSALAAVVERSLARLAPDGEAFEEGSPSPPTASIFFGAAGTSLGLLQMAKTRGDAELLTLADHWLLKARRRVSTDAAWVAESRGLTPDLIDAAAPYHGAGGVALAGAHLARALGEPEMEERALGLFLKGVDGAMARGWRSLDLTLGAAGALLAVADLLPAAPVPVRPEMERAGNDLFETVWGDLRGRQPVGEDIGLRSLGMAHGWAGMLYAGLRWCRALGRQAPAGFEARLSQLAALAEPWGRGLRWRNRIEDGRDLDPLAGWCKGSAGFVFLWEEALRHFPSAGFANLREGAAWHAWEGPDEGPDLCCGIAGRSYALLSLFRSTGDRGWRARAEVLAERAAREALRRDDAPDALYKGGLGVAVLGVDLEPAESMESVAFPCFEETP